MLRMPLAVVLAEAEGCGYGARPGMRAVGGARNVRSGRKPKRGALPPFEPPPGERQPALSCRVGEDVGKMESVHLPKPL